MAGLALAPAHAAAIAIGLLGLGFIALAVVNDGADPVLLLVGFGLLVAAFITGGLRLLMGNDPAKPREDA